MPNRRADFETCLLRADRVSEGRNTPALIAASASAMTFFNSPAVPGKLSPESDAGWQLAEERRTPGGGATAVMTYLYGGGLDQLVASRKDADPLTFYAADDQGSIVMAGTAAAGVVERYNYDDFGRPQVLAPNGTPRRGFRADPHKRGTPKDISTAASRATSPLILIANLTETAQTGHKTRT